tara:strand:- start:3913 stop:5532 length:1620 start_codon:yes stop_codon:yes gene_type:complete
MRLLKVLNSYFLLFLITFLPLNASAQLIGVDDNKMNAIMRGLKKINSRLVELKSDDIKNLKLQLEDLLRQIEEVKQTIPQLQGAIELNKSQTLSEITKVDSKLVDLDAEVKNEVLIKLNQQRQTLENFQGEQKVSLKNLKDQLTKDIEQFDSKSKDNFKNFAIVNKNALEKVVQRLETLETTTNKSFEDTKGTLISSVIPAIAKDNENNRTAILKNLSILSQTNEKALGVLNDKNQKLIEIFGENIKRLENTRTELDAVDKNLTARVMVLDKTLTTVKENTNVNNKNQRISDKKMNKLAAAVNDLQINNAASSKALGVLKDNLLRVQEFEKLTDAKINKLIENSSQLFVQGNQLSESVTKVDQIATVNNKNLMIADEKIIKLAEAIKILQVNSVASGQALGVLKDNLFKVQEFEQLTDTKINKLIENSSQLTVQANQLEESVIKELAESSRKEDSNQDKIDLANEKLSRLIEILKAIAAEQDKLGQVVKVQSELNKAQVGLVKNQESIKKALADLRRKANLNIQGGNDIKKTLSNMKKK